MTLAVIFLPASCTDSPAVKLTEDAETYTLDNGVVKARISKVTGDLVSFRYHDVELLATTLNPDTIPAVDGGQPENNPNWREPVITGHAHGYWSHDAMGVKGSAPATPSVTIDPKTNGGRRVEISIKAIAGERRLGTGPGAQPGGNVTVDIDIRYAMERHTAGVYTYCIFRHPTRYPLAQFTEARYCAKLAPFFDWISVDPEVNSHYPKEHFAGDKYVYTANQWTNPAFGWSSTARNTGLFFINPSMEYMSGGPTKVEFLGHRDTNEEAAPCVLNYWRSSHYGGAEANIAAGEAWVKIIGPMLIYSNTGADPQAMYDDARAKAAEEIAKWPFEWVEDPDYPKAGDRSTVAGQIRLDDIAPAAGLRNMYVGLTAGEYVSPRSDTLPQATVGWQRDAKHYQYWTKADSAGHFVIPNVREGVYALKAFTDGVLGELTMEEVRIAKGGRTDLGELAWEPVRKGRQVWEIGIPNRNASEFAGADKRRDPAISLDYAKLFPNDIVYVAGKSDYASDWFFQHVPHCEDPEARPEPFFGVRAKGRATPRDIVFDLPQTPTGKAILRLAICGTGVRTLSVEVNGQPAGRLEDLTPDGVITRHGSQGIWYEREVVFDASLMKAGSNTLRLLVPEGPVNNGIMYDYLRLELDES